MSVTLQGFRRLVRIIEALAFFVIFSLMGLQAIPLFVFNLDMTLHYATSQQAISQRIAKDALILQYDPNNSTQAINELQVMLPSWESNQRALQNSLLSSDAEALFLSSSSPYASIDASVRSILAHPANIAIQCPIIRMQERPYFLAISQTANILQQEESESRLVHFWIVEGVCVILLAIKGTFVVTVEGTIAGYLKREMAREEGK